MTRYSYIGQRYSQGDSDLQLVTFCASASDVLRWGGVPSKNERFHGGFQRALSARYKKIIEFFDSGQCSPGAIVVAFRESVLQMTDLGFPGAWPDVSQLTTRPQFSILEFSANEEDDLSLAELATRVRDLLDTRPGFSAVDNEQEENGTETEDASENGAAGVEEEIAATADDQDDDLDVGHSKLRAFYDFIGNENAVEAWIKVEEEKIEAIKAKKSLSQQEKEFVAFTPTERLRATLISLLRPAMIVDGQHRVNGANESEKDDIVFTVCAIKDADWVEQVFQFVVLNKMAKPISKDFLTELLNTSLTNREIQDIDKRLEKIGIKNADRRIHKYINHDSRSPFAGLVAEAGEVAGIDSSGKLSQQGMLGLAKRWRSVSAGGKTQEMQCFLPYLDAKTLGEAREAWADYETWMALFFAFWTEVRSIYAPHHIWEKREKYHLLYIVTLQSLQDLFIESKAKGRVKFSSLEDFCEQVRDFFNPVPATFFQNWTATGLQSGQGWDAIKAAVEMFQNGATLAKVQSQSSLFKG